MSWDSQKGMLYALLMLPERLFPTMESRYLLNIVLLCLLNTVGSPQQFVAVRQRA